MKIERPTFPPLQMDDMDARLDQRAAARGIPTLRAPVTEPVLEASVIDEADDETGAGLALIETGLSQLAGQGDEAASRPVAASRRRVPRPIQLRRAPAAPTPEVATPRSRMKSLNVELPDYVWVDLKSRAAREMVSVRHVIVTLLYEAGIEIASVDLIEDGRRLR